MKKRLRQYFWPLLGISAYVGSFRPIIEGRYISCPCQLISILIYGNYKLSSSLYSKSGPIFIIIVPFVRQAR